MRLAVSMAVDTVALGEGMIRSLNVQCHVFLFEAVLRGNCESGIPRYAFRGRDSDCSSRLLKNREAQQEPAYVSLNSRFQRA